MTDEELDYLVSHYRPSDIILEALAGVKLMAVVGPSGVGKTSIIELAIKTSPLFGQVTDVTTRSQRPGMADSEYTFLTLDQFVEAMRRQEFVQVAMMSSTDLKATRPQDYPIGKIGIIAVLSSVIPIFRKLFSELKVVFIVPSSYEAWMQWFNQRQTSEEDQTTRLEEAKTSLKFALNDNNISFVLNDTLEQAVARLIQVAEGLKPNEDEQARKLAAVQLANLEQRP